MAKICINASITPEIWCAHIPEIYGYGIMVLEPTQAQALKSLKRMYFDVRLARKDRRTFKEVYDYFGGQNRQVFMGKAYFDNLGE